MVATPPPAASSYYTQSAVLAAAGAAAARREGRRGLRALVAAIIRYQAAAAHLAEAAVGEMLRQQHIDQQAEALLNPLAFTTETDQLLAMLDTVDTQDHMDRLVESLIQDAARAAENVSVATYEDVGYVRLLNPPSCARCAVLAGRVYRYSTGFLRHPNCDCIMLPTTVANDQLVQDPVELAQQGLVTGLSKADMRAITEHGASFQKVVNIKRKEAGLKQAGRVLSRAGKLTPEGIFALAGDDRAQVVRLLRQYGYIH